MSWSRAGHEHRPRRARPSRSSSEFSIDAVRREGLIAARRRRGPGRTRRHRAGRARPSPSRTRRRRRRERAGPGAARGHRLRLRVVERHRHRLDLRRPRHLPQVQGARRAGDPGHPARRPDLQPRAAAARAGGWPAWSRRRATSTSSYLPLTTRPKAATVGVGRQVILRPAVQKRYVELAEPTLEDQRTDLDRLLRRDRRPRAARRPARCSGGCPGCCGRPTSRSPRSSSTRTSSTSSPATPPACRYAIAFDLGTTTVVATLLDLVTGTPVAVASMLNKQQPFGGDVITRISATMLDPWRLGRLRDAAGETLAELAEPGLPGGRGRARPRLRGRDRRQRHDDRAGAGHRPRAARRRAVRA